MRRTLQFCLMVVMLLGLGNRAWSKAAVGSQVAAWNFTESHAWGGSDPAPPQRSAAGQAAAWGCDLAWTERRQSTPTIPAPFVPQLRSAPFASCRHDPPPSPSPNTSANPALTLTNEFNLYAYCDGDPVDKWLSRDPIEEEGGVNLYGMCGNDCVNGFDILGMLCPVTIEVDGTPNGTVYRGAKTYPFFDGKLYIVPIYTLTVKCAKSGKSKTFGVIRFMPYLNPSNGQDKRYKTVRDAVGMIGLGEGRTYTIKEYRDYHLHSTNVGENGAFVLEGTHYIHDGPNDDTEIFGGAGCLEMFGAEGMEALKKIVAEYSDSKKGSVEEQLKELTKAGMLKAKLKAATRPAVQISPLQIQP